MTDQKLHSEKLPFRSVRYTSPQSCLPNHFTVLLGGTTCQDCVGADFATDGIYFRHQEHSTSAVIARVSIDPLDSLVNSNSLMMARDRSYPRKATQGLRSPDSPLRELPLPVAIENPVTMTFPVPRDEPIGSQPFAYFDLLGKIFLVTGGARELGEALVAAGGKGKTRVF